MFVERFFSQAPKQKKIEDIETSPAVAKAVKALNSKVLGVDFNNGRLGALQSVNKNRANFEEAPYDFERIIEAVDTDSYVQQAFLMYRSLFWKEGWEIVSENDDASTYLWQRIDLFEETMNRPFNDFLQEVVDQLLKFSNVFIVEAREDIRPFFPGTLTPPKGKKTICGYYLIPTETVQILRDKNNKVLAYRQSPANQNIFGPITEYPTWNPDEVIHLNLFKKTGRPFGTPFITPALDDVIALRQIEEDIQNLVHRDLFPLYKYIVGTEDMPSTPEEIVQAAAEIANLRVDGGIILPERHDVDVIGGKNSALDATGYLEGFKHRVAMGLGLYPHHLGMSSGGNRSATDRLDIAVYDRVKLWQAYMEDQIRLKMFNRLLREGGFNPITTPSAEGDSDRCYMRFKEIDIDTQIKKDTNIVNQFAQNVIEFDEARLSIGRRGEVDPNQLFMTMQAHVQTTSQIHVLNAQAQLTPTAPAETTKTTKSATGNSSTTKKIDATPAPKALPPAAIKPDAVKPSVGGTANQPNDKRAKNATRPANQFGRRNSPNVRHMDDSVLSDIIEILERDDSYNV